MSARRLLCGLAALVLLVLAGCFGWLGYRSMAALPRVTADKPVTFTAHQGDEIWMSSDAKRYTTARCTMGPVGGPTRDFAVPGADDGPGYTGQAWWSGPGLLSCDRPVKARLGSSNAEWKLIGWLLAMALAGSLSIWPMLAASSRD